MYFKVFCFFFVIAAATAQEGQGDGKARSSVSISHHTKQLEKEKHEEHHDKPTDYHAYPKYEFEYKVEDHHTGDIKSQHETRDGDAVKGYYTLHQSDGHEREVHYQDDHNTGFQADVKYSINHHSMPKGHH